LAMALLLARLEAVAYPRSQRAGLVDAGLPERGIPLRAPCARSACAEVRPRILLVAAMAGEAARALGEDLAGGERRQLRAPLQVPRGERGGGGREAKARRQDSG